MSKDKKEKDTIVMYCSYFTYCDQPLVEREYVVDKIDKLHVLNKIKTAEGNNIVQSGTHAALVTFFTADGATQRQIFDDSSESNKKAARAAIKAMFEVINKIQSEIEISYYVLCHINGILEDLRSRVSHFVEVMNHFQEKVNLI